MSYASLVTLYGELLPGIVYLSENILEFDQKPYISTGFAMQDKGYVYVPTACRLGESCRLFVEFHGCKQTLNDIGTDYVKHLGLNEIAEANNIIILYPQAKSS